MVAKEKKTLKKLLDEVINLGLQGKEEFHKQKPFRLPPGKKMGISALAIEDRAALQQAIDKEDFPLIQR